MAQSYKETGSNVMDTGYKRSTAPEYASEIYAGHGTDEFAGHGIGSTSSETRPPTDLSASEVVDFRGDGYDEAIRGHSYDEGHGHIIRSASEISSAAGHDTSSANARKRQRLAEVPKEHAQGLLDMGVHRLSQTNAQLEEISDPFEREAAEHVQTKSQLQATEQQLRQTQLQLQAAHLAFKKQHQELDELRKRWRDSANQLDRVLRQGQALNQVTDDEIIQKANALRFSIKSFALQFFGDDIMGLKVDETSFKFLNGNLRLPRGTFDAYMLSQSFRPMLMRAIIWAFLHGVLLGTYAWAPECAQIPMEELKGVLMPATTEGSYVTPEDMSKFHKWRANTAALLLQAMGTAVDVEIQAVADYAAEEISHFFTKYSKSEPRAIETRFSDLIKKALELDKIFSLQVAHLVWNSMPASHGNSSFRPNIMELERGKPLPRPDQKLGLVLAPGLTKWGKSSGTDFNVRTRLLKIEVSFESPPTAVAPSVSTTNVPHAGGGSGRGHSRGSVQFLRDRLGLN